MMQFKYFLSPCTLSSSCLECPYLIKLVSVYLFFVYLLTVYSTMHHHPNTKHNIHMLLFYANHILYCCVCRIFKCYPFLRHDGIVCTRSSVPYNYCFICLTTTVRSRFLFYTNLTDDNYIPVLFVDG